jgi:hypothetical protein
MIFNDFSKLLRITLNTFAEGPLTDFSDITKGSLFYTKLPYKSSIFTRRRLPAQGLPPAVGAVADWLGCVVVKH